MPLLYICLGLLGLFLLYVLTLVVCALLVDTRREYTSHNPFYRALLDSATVIGMGIMGIRLHVSGTERLPQGEKPLFVIASGCLGSRRR